MNRTADILARHDANQSAAAIATAESLSVGYVYSILRHHRPKRSRSARRRVSEVPGKVAGLAAVGIKPDRIAFLLGVSRAYVYRILAE